VKGKARVNYRKGKRSKAPAWLRKLGYHLTFFEFLEDAIRFKRVHDSLQNSQIWKVRGQKVDGTLPKLELGLLGRGGIAKVMLGGGWPSGTSTAEVVIPVEKVDRNTLRREVRRLGLW
jgi:hypothetical protein